MRRAEKSKRLTTENKVLWSGKYHISYVTRAALLCDAFPREVIKLACWWGMSSPSDVCCRPFPGGHLVREAVFICAAVRAASSGGT